MSARVLALILLVAAPVAGFAAAHDPDETQVTCAGGENYPVPAGQVFYPSKIDARLQPADRIDDPNEVPSADPRLRVNTYYVVVSQNPDHYKDVSATGPWRDADKAHPVSVWKETNLKSGLQTTTFQCKWSDGDLYQGPNPAFAKRDMDLGVAPPYP